MFLPESDRDYLNQKEYSFQEITENGKNGLIISNWILPKNKYSLEKSDLLIFLPTGYPDIPIDMFYFYPAILLSGNAYAHATDVIESFNAISWQRWSRHLGAEHWRPEIDGIHTYLKRVENALLSAI